MRDLPPGPREPTLVQVHRYARNPVGYIERCVARYGDSFTLRLLGAPTVVFVSSPEAMKDLFAAPTDVAQAGEANRFLDFLLGPHSLFRLDGAQHTRERQLMMPPFHGDRMRTYTEQMQAVTHRMIDRWSAGRALPFYDAAQELTLEIILECVFGIPASERRERFGGHLKRYLALTMTQQMLLLWMTVPGLWLRALFLRGIAPLADALDRRWGLGRRVPGAELARVIREIDRFLHDDLAARRASGAIGKADIMSMLIEARDEHGVGLTDAELRDEMISLLVAGHETSATSLTWALSKILEHPEVLGAIVEELGRVAGDRPLSADRAVELRYLDAAIKETLRLYGPVPAVGRLLRAPMRIGGRELPAGTLVAGATCVLHRNPKLWPDPGRFDPTRFLDRRPKVHEYSPFGGGPRICLGMSFTLFEMKIVLATLLQRVALRPAARTPPELVQRGFLLGPSGRVPVIPLEIRPVPGSPAPPPSAARTS